MQLQDVLLLYDYCYWATGKVLAAATGLSEERFTAPTPQSHGSLRGTLVHTLDTEYGWRMLCQRGVRAPDMTESEFPTLDLLKQRWHDEERAMRDYLCSLKNHDLSSVIRYTTDSGEPRERVLWHCLLHVVNHGTHHRSQAAAILRGYGRSPGDIDFTVFLNEWASQVAQQA